MLQKVATIANADLQLVVVQLAHIHIVAQIAARLAIYIAAIILFLWLDLRGFDHSGTAGGFCTRGPDLITHLTLELVAQAILLQKIAAIANAGLQLVVIQFAHILVIAQIATSLTI